MTRGRFFLHLLERVVTGLAVALVILPGVHFASTVFGILVGR